MPSPVGELLLTADGTGALTRVFFPPYTVPPDAVRDDAALTEAHRQLDAYFSGTLTVFDLPLAPSGTGFQRAVWRALSDIPYGATISYGELARRIGQPDAARAVGLANGQNPIAIIVPCHRVIGASGTLTGYGGGLARKHWLLTHERRLREPELFT
ncbi:MAG: methylated-DNA--[protein]-cysteine S-methyltransferase [Bacteroidetes bacterium]|nr:methylated-DNA--[protein]-cysteine S-methyltransferase [Bacteroidota bacterium]